MVQFPLLTAKTVNQTLLFTMASPQLNTGSVPDAVAREVVLDLELLAHSDAGEEQSSCPFALIPNSRISTLKYINFLFTVFY